MCFSSKQFIKIFALKLCKSKIKELVPLISELIVHTQTEFANLKILNTLFLDRLNQNSHKK